MSVTLSNLKPARGSKHRRKILGRGEGSGHGQTATRGMKGQRSRAGDGRMMGFEGGQIPLLRRLPKRGFNNSVFSHRFSVVNLHMLERNFEPGQTVTLEALDQRRLIDPRRPVKILGQGQLTKKLTVQAHAASRRACEVITQAGGRLELLSPAAPAAPSKR